LISKETVLNKVQELDIFQYYIDEPIRINKPIKSPLRNEKNPSFVIYKNDRHQVVFKDFAGIQGSCFDFVMEMYGLSFREAVLKIAADFNIQDEQSTLPTQNYFKPSYISKPKKTFVEEKSDTHAKYFSIVERDWEVMDKRFWSQFGINRKTLELYNVKPISKVINHVKNYEIDDSRCSIMYAYNYGNDRYKIYRPFLKSGKKYFGNTKRENIFGMAQLEDPDIKTREVILLCAGQKDVMSLYNNTAFIGIALNSETSALTTEQYNSIRSKCNHLITCYDNDDTGRARSVKLYEEYGIPYIDLREITKANDIAEYFQQGGAYQLLHKLVFFHIN